MALLLSVNGISKQFGARPLFSDLSLTVSDGERHALIGPNGAGKSTLLEILAQRQPPDAGEVACRKLARAAFVAQEPAFPDGATVRSVLEAAAREPGDAERFQGQAGLPDPDAPAASLSGGGRKRLALAAALASRPDLLLLDEPTNHLDVEGIEWLESVLHSARFASVTVSHDRYFLENTATHLMELNPAYPDGLFCSPGNYSAFLEKRDDWFRAQDRERDALANAVRREVAWLRRGPKARTTKSKARADAARDLVESLAEMDGRREGAALRIAFTATERRSRRLLAARGLRKSLGGRTVVGDLSLALAPGHRLGLAGANGSGKTTLLRLLAGALEPDGGTVERAEGLRAVYFDQHRDELDPAWTLKRALAPDGDAVVYQGRSVHVIGWARRFLFREEQLEQPVGSLSGGERARVLIARLMLRPADVLLLDEPTNDLDLPALEVLEENLLLFPGALVLVTHDRYLMDRVCTAVMGLDGEGGAALYADREQFEADRGERRAARRRETAEAAAAAVPVRVRPARRLSWQEQKEWDAMEAAIEGAEAELARLTDELHDPAIASDAARLETLHHAATSAQAEVDRLYARWAELDAKRSAP
ncbi:MAG: ABC-F family ATP-binding cassette domain-containing protein [Acidobacteria bacterium]|nr:ABC-F family ATP-binding cassette domain-containing protein [Acidobacteriota bacterium]